MYMYVLWGISFVKFSHEMSILILFYLCLFLSHAISLVTILCHDYHVTLQSFVIVSWFV